MTGVSVKQEMDGQRQHEAGDGRRELQSNGKQTVKSSMRPETNGKTPAETENRQSDTIAALWARLLAIVWQSSSCYMQCHASHTLTT